MRKIDTTLIQISKTKNDDAIKKSDKYRIFINVIDKKLKFLFKISKNSIYIPGL